MESNSHGISPKKERKYSFHYNDLKSSCGETGPNHQKESATAIKVIIKLGQYFLKHHNQAFFSGIDPICQECSVDYVKFMLC